jgi:hypothetical protein
MILFVRRESMTAAGHGWRQRAYAMLKLIVILAAAIPVILFLRTLLCGKSRVLSQATADFRRQIDYLMWGILFVIGCWLVYSIGTLIHSMWR